MQDTRAALKRGRYRICYRGQFVRGMDSYDDRDAAMVACLNGPVGCEVYDTRTRKWVGPTSLEEIRGAQERLNTRVSAVTLGGSCRCGGGKR